MKVSEIVCADWFEKSGAPKRHRDCKPDWSGAWGKKMEAVSEKIAARPDSIVALIGPRGPGKTQAGVEIIRSACMDGRRALYRTAYDIFAAVKGSFHNREVADPMTMFCDCPLLVIDEIQVRSESKWENDSLTHLIDYRYGEMLPTVIIGNLTLEAFKKHIGESAYDRIVECGKIFVFDGTNFRAEART